MLDRTRRRGHGAAVSYGLADRPFAPRSFPFFYGWVIAFASTLGILASMPWQTMGVSVFTDPLMDATGLSRLSVSNAYLAGTILSGLSLPIGGRLLDRFGARRTGLFASVGLAVVLALMSQIDRVASALGGAALTTVVLLVAGFFGLRFTGQGLLTMTSRTMLGRWFDAKRGMVAGMSGLLVGFGFGVTPQLFDAWIARAGWRAAWLEMAVAIGLGMAAIVLAFYRDTPELCGLEMDGRRPGPPAANSAPDRPAEVGFTQKQALATGAFWAITSALAIQAMMITGITFHIVDIGASAGVGRADAVGIFLPMAVVSVVAALVGGIAGDRLPVRGLFATMMIGLTMGMLGSANLEERRWLVIIGLGISGGLFSPASTIAYPRFFGRKHLGAIVGVEMMGLVLASALGPSYLAVSRTFFDSYAPALNVGLILPAMAMVGLMTFRSPRPPPAW